MAAEEIPGERGAAEHPQEAGHRFLVALPDLLRMHARAKPEVAIVIPVGAAAGHQPLGDSHLIATVARIPPRHRLQSGEAFARRMGPEDSFASHIEAPVAPILKNLPLRLHIFLRRQPAMLGKSVPGADRLAIIALGDEDIDVDRVAILQFGHHLDEPVDSALRQSRLPFAGIDDVVHVVPHDLDAGYEQLAFLVLGQQILLDILIPQRAMAIGIEHVDMEADGRVVTPCLADEPTQAFQRRGVMGQFQPGVDLIPGRIAMVMAPFLPADEVDDLGDAAGEIVGFADHLQRLLKGAEHIVRLLEERLFRQSLHRLPLHPQKELRHQTLVVIAIEGGDHHTRAGGMLLAILFQSRLNAGDAPGAGQNPSIFNGNNLHPAAGLGGGGGDCGGSRIERQPLPRRADGSECDSRGPMGIAQELERGPVEGDLKAFDRRGLRSRC